MSIVMITASSCVGCDRRELRVVGHPMKYGTSQLFTILLLSLVLTSGSGCHVLQIPSYRASVVDRSADQESSVVDRSADQESEAYSFSHSHNSLAACSDPSCSDPSCLQLDACPPGLFPPLPAWGHSTWACPGWYTAWRARRDLPDPPPYPRFHPLPTRPMFQPPATDYVSSSSGLPPNAVPWEQRWESPPSASNPAPVYGQLPGGEAGGALWQRSRPLAPLGESSGGVVPLPSPAPTPAPDLIPESLPSPLPLDASRNS